MPLALESLQAGTYTLEVNASGVALGSTRVCHGMTPRFTLRSRSQITHPSKGRLSAAFLVCFGAMIGCSFTALAQPVEFAFTPTNASGTFYGQATVNGVPANANDWIAAFDDMGNCAGAAQVIMNDGLAYINLPIYGDDMTTSTVDEGITGAEPFTLNLARSVRKHLDYPGFDAILLLEGWSNTNGAPMPGFDDPRWCTTSVKRKRRRPSAVLKQLCGCRALRAGHAPAGGVLVVPGGRRHVQSCGRGEGIHTVEYIYNGVLASWTVEVLPSLDATIVTEGPFCANEAPVTLEAATSGGTWTGDGVFGDVFDPAFVSPGTFNLTYEPRARRGVRRQTNRPSRSNPAPTSCRST